MASAASVVAPYPKKTGFSSVMLAQYESPTVTGIVHVSVPDSLVAVMVTVYEPVLAYAWRAGSEDAVVPSPKLTVSDVAPVAVASIVTWSPALTDDGVARQPASDGGGTGGATTVTRQDSESVPPSFITIEVTV